MCWNEINCFEVSLFYCLYLCFFYKLVSLVLFFVKKEISYDFSLFVCFKVIKVEVLIKFFWRKLFNFFGKLDKFGKMKVKLDIFLNFLYFLFVFGILFFIILCLVFLMILVLIIDSLCLFFLFVIWLLLLYCFLFCVYEVEELSESVLKVESVLLIF